MINTNTLDMILSQKEKLIAKIPHLENYFIPISFPNLQKTIPFLPIRCFRDFDLHTIFTEQNSNNFKIFLSSGSTGNKRSRHIFSSVALENYEKNSCAGFLNFLTKQGLNKNTSILSLVPTPNIWPTSSLAAMVHMFAKNGFNITWCDTDSKKENFLFELKKIPIGGSCIIFGTTFHHVTLAHCGDKKFTQEVQNICKQLKIIVVDTGGTKGRTEALSLDQSIEICKNLYSSPNFSFTSEYGMCELSSQAWSEHKIHNGSFVANETLFPYSISLQNNCVLEHNKNGFIGFIDTVNRESWAAIITEDIGFTYNENKFHLLGRGPDASIKGCSLNVRNIFTFSQESSRTIVPCHNKFSWPLKLNDIAEYLQNNLKWDHFSIQDFKMQMLSLEKQIPIDEKFKQKNCLFISAANTPIAFVFPFFIAGKSEANSITIKIPSLRLDDYFANKVIEKTKNLIDIFAQYFPNTKTYVDAGRSIAQTFSQYDIVLTFGTNETLETIEQQIDKQKTEFIGRGDIKNSLCVSPSSNSPKTISNLCSLWNGRGCLTPVVLFCHGTAEEKKSWTTEFAQNLEKEFLQRFEVNPIHLLQEFAHAHNCAFVQGQLLELGLIPHNIIFRGSLTCVVDLSCISMEQFSKLEIDLNFGGCGFVYVLPFECRGKLKALSEMDVLPKI